MKIPFTFIHESVGYEAVLAKVSGAGGNEVWHLLMNRFYKGQLMLVNDHWVLFGLYHERADEFGLCLEQTVPMLRD